jgi:hypothetical protein
MENPERLEQILSALPVIESRRDTVKAEASFLLSASFVGSVRDTIPTTTKQAERELQALRNRVSRLRLHVGKIRLHSTRWMSTTGPFSPI